MLSVHHPACAHFAAEVLTLLLILTLASCTPAWTVPHVLKTFLQSKSATVDSVFHDTVYALTHFVCADPAAKRYHYFSAFDNGTLLHSAAFPAGDVKMAARLVGSWSDRRLFLAFQSVTSSAGAARRKERMTISFTESADGGKTWAKVKVVPNDRSSRMLQDLLVAPQSSRLILVYVNSKGELRVTTRPPGSTVFASDSLAAKGVPQDHSVAKSAHGAWIEGPTLHVFYRAANQGLFCVRSYTNGLTWTSPRLIDPYKASSISAAITDPLFPGPVYVGYETYEPAPARVAAVVNHGNDVSIAANATRGNVTSATNGLAICSGVVYQSVASMFISSQGEAEFAEWDPRDMKREERPHPFCGKVTSARLGCVVGTTVNITAFVTVREGNDTVLYMATEYDSLLLESGREG